MGRARVEGRAPLVSAAALLLALVGVAVAGCGGDGGGEEKGQTVRFQKPTAAGADPFTKPADVRGDKRVDVGSGPFGGTGSDLVCDRELLIRSLKARPERLRGWAKVVDVEPTPAAVTTYIRKLRPVTLVRDTRVTNHSFSGGRAQGYQAILQAGTAVLVDEEGHYRARCRCGNPLLEPIFVETARCLGCPPNYDPPPPCQPESECWEEYPDPPPVEGEASTTPDEPPPPDEPTTTAEAPAPQGNPQASFNRSSGRRGDSFSLSISGFTPNAEIPFTLSRPDGVSEQYSISTGADGSGTFTFNPSGGQDPLGTYTASVRDPQTGREASASTQLVE